MDLHLALALACELGFMIVGNQVLAIAAVKNERWRQDKLKFQGKFDHTAADPDCTDLERITMLMEEVGEVAEAMQNQDEDNLYDELVQVAAVSVAWVEHLIEKKKVKQIE